MPKQQEFMPPIFSLVAFSVGIALLASFTMDDSTFASGSSYGREHGMGRAPSTFEIPSLAPSATVLNSLATYRVEAERVKFYFVPGRAEVAAEVNHALQHFIDTIPDQRRVQVTGFFEEGADGSKHLQLVEKRVGAVQRKLERLGVQPATIQTEFASFKPSVLNSYGKSRRVEITLVDSE